ncbi:hypothetical protein ACFFV7_41005 [Nonomuraea spiralis]|uniref:Uncharacterized protein n=1 Tax=Nonomuraea spiralis TaxID=46182 RepID=A0ABV5IST0_9ACTN|nr:hypothetical protein [Nonomuraea spiralis]GGT17383.1 hypothetical protein GCM10010176_072530 [Nonomuraea spiralis]
MTPDPLVTMIAKSMIDAQTTADVPYPLRAHQDAPRVAADLRAAGMVTGSSSATDAPSRTAAFAAPYGVIASGDARLVVAARRTGEHRVAGHLNQAAISSRDRRRHVHRSRRGGRPIRLPVRGVDDRIWPDLTHQRVYVGSSAHIEGQPLNPPTVLS